jgi:catechol-2,3-dioxygenase
MNDADSLEISRLALAAPRDSMAELAAFYGRVLGLPRIAADANVLSFGVGPARLEFHAAEGDARPFYHFALLVPGDRFAAAQSWLATRMTLLPHPDNDSTTFDFDFWNAQACYFHDPAGSIVEFIAHRGHAEKPGATEIFSTNELAGISEIGIVTSDPGATAGTLERDVGIEVWDGGLDGATSLAFIGRKAHTLIICRPDRGWLPTGRPAESHPVDITLTGDRDAVTELSPVPCRIRVTRS